MGRFDTLMYDNRNWKGTIALVASMLIGLAVGYKGFDQLPDLQNDHRAASVTLLKARRVLDKQSVTTPNYGKAWMQVQMADNRVRAADVGIYLSNITFG